MAEHRVQYMKEIEFGGLIAKLMETKEGAGSGNLDHQIWIEAIRWKGKQPKLVISPCDSGYQDWRRLLDPLPTKNALLTFASDSEIGNLSEKWLSSVPLERR